MDRRSVIVQRTQQDTAFLADLRQVMAVADTEDRTVAA